MKKIYIAATAAVALGILLVSSLVMATPGSPQQGGAGIAATATCIPGEIFEGDYLRIGINNGGTLGVTNGTNPGTCMGDPGVGFQSVNDTPFKSPSTESLAWELWGEGYKIAYKEGEKKPKMLVDTVAYWQPNFEYPPPPETNIVPVSEKLIIDDEEMAVKEIEVMTKDKKLLITFKFTFLKEYPELNLETTIKNVGNKPLRDVVYTRIIDWDVCADITNSWASTAQEAYAWNACSGLEFSPIVQLTAAGHDGDFKKDIPLPLVNYVDLYAWDDMTVRSPMDVFQSFVPRTNFDGNAGIYYKIGELKQQQSKTVYLVYQSNFPKIK